MPDISLWVRGFGVFVLLCALGGLFVGAGAFEATPFYPDNEALVDEYDDHVGEKAAIDGAVVSTDPLVIEVGTDLDSIEITVSGVEETATPGDRVVLFGTVEPDRTIEAHNVIVREPWEIQYLYAISLGGGFWVLGRFINGWRFDRNAMAFVPRERTLTAGDYGGRSDG